MRNDSDKDRLQLHHLLADAESLDEPSLNQAIELLTKHHFYRLIYAQHLKRLEAAKNKRVGEKTAENVSAASIDRRLELPPCYRLRRWSLFVYCKKTYERVFEQHFADVDVEYTEALAKGDIAKARWVKIRGVMCFWMIVATHAAESTIGQLVRKIVS